MSNYIKTFDDFMGDSRNSRVKVTPDLSMEDLYAAAGIQTRKSAKIKKKHQHVIDDEIDGYLDGLFDGLPGEEARKRGQAKGERRKKLSENSEIYEYDAEVNVDDIGVAAKKAWKKEKEFSYREYVEQPKEKSKCFFKIIFEAIFGKSDKNKECVELKF